MLWVISRLVLQPENTTASGGRGVLVEELASEGVAEGVDEGVSVRVTIGEGVLVNGLIGVVVRVGETGMVGGDQRMV
jgi:hypothetical protein